MERQSLKYSVNKLVTYINFFIIARGQDVWFTIASYAASYITGVVFIFV